MSPTLTKIIVAIGVIATFGALAFIIYNQQQIKNQQTAIQSQVVAQQQLVDGIVRSQSSYATAAQLAQFASDNQINLQAIQDNLKTLNSSLAAINVVTVDSSGQTNTSQPSSSIGPSNPALPQPTQVTCTPGGTVTCPNTDPFGYQAKEQDFALNEDFGTLKVPFGTVGFSAWQANPWNDNILPREYNVDTVVGTDVNERQTFYNKFTVNVGGKTYDIPIKTATTEQQVPAASFSWWNPRLLWAWTEGLISLTYKVNLLQILDWALCLMVNIKPRPTSLS